MQQLDWDQVNDWLSEQKAYVPIMGKTVYRAVETQSQNETRRLVASDDEQVLLEHILDDSKPPYRECSRSGKTHYLIATPFRYQNMTGARFTAPGCHGHFYCADNVKTALYEVGYWAWKFFFIESDMKLRPNQTSKTVFKAVLNTESAINLDQTPWNKYQEDWKQADDYSSTQKLATMAIEGQCECIQYQSVRDPDERPCFVAFYQSILSIDNANMDEQNWNLSITDFGVRFTNSLRHSEFFLSI